MLFVSSLFNLFWKPGPQSILGDRRPCSTHRRSNAFEVHRFCICAPPFLPSFEPETLSWIILPGLNMIDSYVWPSSLCLCPIFLLHKTSFSLCWSISLFVIGRLCKLNPLPIWGQRGATWERAREMFQMCTVFCTVFCTVICAVFCTVCALCTARPVTRSKSQDPCLMARSLVICNRSRCFYERFKGPERQRCNNNFTPSYRPSLLIVGDATTHILRYKYITGIQKMSFLT